jgi:hypothetical protein
MRSTSTILYPREWNHDALTHAQLEAVVLGYARTQGMAQGILDRRVGVAAYREEDPRGVARWVWRLALSPLGVQLRRIEKDRRRLARRVAA